MNGVTFELKVSQDSQVNYKSFQYTRKHFDETALINSNEFFIKK